MKGQVKLKISMSAANFQIGYTAAIAALYGNEDFNTMHAIFENDYSDG